MESHAAEQQQHDSHDTDHQQQPQRQGHGRNCRRDRGSRQRSNDRTECDAPGRLIQRVSGEHCAQAQGQVGLTGNARDGEARRPGETDTDCRQDEESDGCPGLRHGDAALVADRRCTALTTAM